MANREQPCPYRIVEDFGSGFSMGCAAGCIIYFIRGSWYAPRKEKFYSGITLLKKRAPILGGTSLFTKGSFALWAGLFSITDCTLIAIRNTEDAFNQITAGAVTGGLLAFRAGGRVAMKNALFGGMILASIRIVETVVMKMNRKQELQMQSEMI